MVEQLKCGGGVAENIRIVVVVVVEVKQ